ncbi:MAG: DUF2298 domain-containing protein, partial [Dehalococcoidia bacterium]
ETPAEGFGRSVSLDSNRLAAGATGSAFVYRRAGGKWGNERIVLPPNAAARPSFGGAVALQDPYLVVTAKNARNPAPRSGAAHVFKREDEAWRLQTELRTEDASSDASFGSAVALDANTVLAGAPGSGHGAGYLFGRSVDKWSIERKLVSRWRFGPALLAVGLVILAALLLAAPFLANFESNATGVLPLRGLMSRPLHLLLVWGAFALLVVPLFFLTLRRLFAPGNWSLMRFGVAMFIGFTPVVLWLQPIWGVPFYLTALLFNATVLLLFGLHRAGYRLARVDEMSFALNSGATRVAGTVLLLGLLLWDGIVHGERGVEGQYLAIDRLLIVTPMALVVSLAIFGAWTLAHRDSERRRLSLRRPEGRVRNDGHVPVLLFLAFAAALIMGVELFHVTDFFTSDLRRMNTVFKAYYQAWLLMAVLGGFGLWYVSRRFHMRTARMRLATAACAVVLFVTVATVIYYPLAAVSTRGGGAGDRTLDGLAHLSESAPAEYEAIQWIRGNLPRDTVVLESAVVTASCPDNPAGCSDFTEAGRVSSSSGRATVLGWEQHEMQWHSDASEVHVRKADVRAIYETPDPAEARRLLSQYGVGYVVVGPRERSAYGREGLDKFSELGEQVFHSAAGGAEVMIYRLSDGETAG